MVQYGPGGHKPDGTGPPPKGRGKGPGGGTGTKEIYKKNDDELETEDKDQPIGSLEEEIRKGPGGNIPDGTGPPPKGRGSGPGEGRGEDLREELDHLYIRYKGREEELDSYIAQYNDEATDLNLVGQERIDYIREHVEGRMDKEKSAYKDLDEAEVEDSDEKADTEKEEGAESDDGDDGDAAEE